MSISINAVLRKDKINRANHAPINIRLTRKTKSRYVPTGVTLPISEWDAETQQISTDYPNAGELQFKIDSVRNEYEKKIKRLQALDIEVDFETLLGTKSKQINCTVEEFFQQQVEQMQSIGKIGTASKYDNCLKMLSKCNSVNIRFDQIDIEYLRNYEKYLLGKGNASNSIATKFSVFKAVYNKAIVDGVFQSKDNPFVKFKVGRLWTKTRKRAITKEDIQKIIALEIPHDYRSNYKTLARDIFLFSYSTMGINFGDIAHLKHKDIRDGRICYSRRKTQKMLTCQLTPLAVEIIGKYTEPNVSPEDYIFPIFDSDLHLTAQQQFNRVHKVLAKINSALHDLGEEIGLNIPLTTYCARHSFATVLKRSGVNIAIISESLGHSDLSTTQIYLDSFENSQIDEAMKNLL